MNYHAVFEAVDKADWFTVCFSFALAYVLAEAVLWTLNPKRRKHYEQE